MLTGQAQLPAIQFEDGHRLREESRDLVARIREGRFDEATGSPPGEHAG
jgi:hypothetical protein